MEQEKAIVVSGLTSISGTLEEKVKAFQQMSAAASSGLFPAGYDNVQKIQAACWFADGLGVHPTVYMEGVQPVQFGSKTMREPKWEFVNALLRARLPGFDFVVHEESEEACEIEFFAAGRKPQRVRYTMDEAVKQGLAGTNGRNRDTYEKNARKMLFKQNFKIGADRIGADVLSGLPSLTFDEDATPTREPSTAEVLEAEIAKHMEQEIEPNAGVAPDKVVPVAETHAGPEFRPGAAAPAPADAVGPRKRAYLLIRQFYGGKITDAVALEKASFLYNALQEEKTGVNPKAAFTKAGHLGPVEAEQIIEYLTAKMAKAAAPTGAGEVGSQPPGAAATLKIEHVGGGGVTWTTEPDDDEAPPAEVVEPEPEARSARDAFNDLFTTVARARPLFGAKHADGSWTRSFIKEAPPGSGKFYYVDDATFREAGDSVSIKLQVGPDIVAPVAKLDQLNRILSAACDAAERERR